MIALAEPGFAHRLRRSFGTSPSPPTPARPSDAPLAPPPQRGRVWRGREARGWQGGLAGAEGEANPLRVPIKINEDPLPRLGTTAPRPAAYLKPLSRSSMSLLALVAGLAGAAGVAVAGPEAAVVLPLVFLAPFFLLEDLFLEASSPAPLAWAALLWATAALEAAASASFFLASA